MKDYKVTAQAVNQGHAISVDYGEGDKPKESMKHYFDGEMGLHDKATLESLINNDMLSMLAARLIADGNAQDEVVEYAHKGVLVEIQLKNGVTWRARNGRIGRVKMLTQKQCAIMREKEA